MENDNFMFKAIVEAPPAGRRSIEKALPRNNGGAAAVSVV
jgi:hypothetical protein